MSKASWWFAGKKSGVPDEAPPGNIRGAPAGSAAGMPGSEADDLAALAPAPEALNPGGLLEDDDDERAILPSDMLEEADKEGPTCIPSFTSTVTDPETPHAHALDGGAAGPINSFASAGGGIRSFGSTVTDFDGYTSIGAQAERNPDYQRDVYAGGMMPPSLHLWGGMPGMPPVMTPSPYYPGQMGWGCGGAFGMTAWEPSGGSAAPGASPEELRALADSLQAQANQLVDAARRLEATQQARRAGQGGAQATSRGRAGSGTASRSQRGSVVEEPIEEEAANTTVMLRNIPNDYTRAMLLELLDAEGFKASYDFVYLPIDFKRKAGLGYAFVNLVDHDVAERFMRHFEGYARWKFSSQKKCEAAWGQPLQGLEQHIERYRNSPLMHDDVPDEYKPILFQDGIPTPFPEPLKRIRPPRVKLQPGPQGAT